MSGKWNHLNASLTRCVQQETRDRASCLYPMKSASKSRLLVTQGAFTFQIAPLIWEENNCSELNPLAMRDEWKCVQAITKKNAINITSSLLVLAPRIQDRQSRVARNLKTPKEKGRKIKISIARRLFDSQNKIHRNWSASLPSSFDIGVCPCQTCLGGQMGLNCAPSERRAQSYWPSPLS